MQKTVLVLDLDDTLYDELSYVLSGFQAVAKFLEETKGFQSKKSFIEMQNILQEVGRGSVFDIFLKKHDIFSKALVKKCLSVYRHHTPKIMLYPDAKKFIEKNHDKPLYLVTDGHKIVQENKIKALGLDKKMKHCYLTNRYGIKNNKPSPHCFLSICKKEKVAPEQVVYIGDNPYKDFVGLKPHLFQTIRILRGHYKDIKLDKAHEADRTINTLNEL